MPLDVAIEKAVAEATNELGQKKALSQRIVAWLRALSEGESSDDQDRNFLENVLSAIELKGAPDAD